MSLSSDFLGPSVTIEDVLIGTEVTQADLDAGDQYAYDLAERMGVTSASITLPSTKYAVRDLVIAVACQRRAGIRAGRQPFGEDDPYMSKQKYYAKEIDRLTAILQPADFGASTSQKYSPFNIRMARG